MLVIHMVSSLNQINKIEKVNDASLMLVSWHKVQIQYTQNPFFVHVRLVYA